MDGTEQLCSLNKAKARRQKKPNSPEQLSDSLNKLMERWITPRHEKFGSLIQMWDQLLPAELSKHCRLSDISGGQLKVLVDSSAYMHELRLCSPELIDELQRQFPKARIRNIKFVIDHTANQNL